MTIDFQPRPGTVGARALTALAEHGGSLWDDGDVVLQGIVINEDAGSVTLSDAQARRVHRFLERVYGPTV